MNVKTCIPSLKIKRKKTLGRMLSMFGEDFCLVRSEDKYKTKEGWTESPENALVMTFHEWCEEMSGNVSDFDFVILK